MTNRPDTSVFKVCSTCKESKPRTEFWKAKAKFDGLQAVCKSCGAGRHHSYVTGDRVSNAARARKWRAENPDRAKDHYNKFHYGIKVGTYDKMLAAQDGKCAICGTADPAPRKRFAVDHCHTTQAVRGLLCMHCNTGLGYLKEDPAIFLKGIEYLARHKQE